MKIRNPVAITALAFIISLVARAWMATVRVEEIALADGIDPRRRGCRRCVYLFWHEYIAIAAGSYARLRIPVLISQHRDGELITKVARFLGGDAIRGSTTRGGVKAIRAMVQHLKAASLVITPDGPRGPRRIMQQGAVYVASEVGADIVPLGIHPVNTWRLKSWDRFALPKPFSKVRVVLGRPITVPAGLERDDMAQYIAECQKGMDEAHAIAAGEVPVPEAVAA
jgi:lysophospholipid acyltransferase (LPLAT)-like uncharacterized protein